MKDLKAQNQSYLRLINQKTILNYLMRQKMSCSDLAKKMKLSVTAVAKITEELVNNNILIKQESELSEVGRRPIMLEINPEGGVFFVISLRGRYADIAICDISGKITVRKQIKVNDKITLSDLDYIADNLKSQYKAVCNDKRLMCICIAAPGKIDPVTGNFLVAHYFEECEKINLHNIFSQHFDCEIIIQNDIKLALEGERVFGSKLKGVKNAMMIHIGYSVGSALMLNEKIYGGAHGFAGEISGFSINAAASEDDIMYFAEKRNCLEAVSAESIIKTAKKQAMLNGEKNYMADALTIIDIVTAYNSGSDAAKKAFFQAATIWAKTIRSMAEFLDIEAVIISGGIVLFGDIFKNIIEDYVNSTLKYQDIKVTYSEFGDEGIIKGAINTAVSSALNIMLANIKQTAAN